MHSCSALFFFNDTATTEIYTLSLHDALPICDVDPSAAAAARLRDTRHRVSARAFEDRVDTLCRVPVAARAEDRKSTRLNSSHANISYAVFCLKKNNRLITYHLITHYEFMINS